MRYGIVSVSPAYLPTRSKNKPVSLEEGSLHPEPQILAPVFYM